LLIIYVAVLREIIYTMKIGEHIVDFLFMSMMENSDLKDEWETEEENK